MQVNNFSPISSHKSGQTDAKSRPEGTGFSSWDHLPALGTYVYTDLRPFSDSAESFEWKKRLIQSAESSIELSPNFAGGEVFRDVLEIMKERMDKKPQLKIHLLLSKDLLEAKDIAILNEMASKYENFHFLISDRLYVREPFIRSEENHVKLLIVDEKYFMIGGTGIHPRMVREVHHPDEKEKQETLASKILDQGFRDADLAGEGKIAGTMRLEFFKLFRTWENRMLRSDHDRFFTMEGLKKGTCRDFHEQPGLIEKARMKVLVGGPEQKGQNSITLELAKRIDKTVKDIKIANLLFNPDPRIKKSLQDKKRKGVQITGHFNALADHYSNLSISHNLFVLPNRVNYYLLNNVYEYDIHRQLYHKKVAIFDDLYTVIGSYNLGIKSAYCDNEIVCVIKDPRVNELMRGSLESDAKNSHVESPNVSFLSQFKGFLSIQILGPFYG